MHKHLLFVFVTIFLVLTSCKTTQKENTEPYYSETDSYGREVVLNKEPMRIVSFSPSITEIVYLLNAEEKLVGITNYCTYPEATQNIEKVGNIQPINFEKVLSLNPDLVLIGSIVSRNDVDKMEKLGIPIIAIKEETSIEGLYQSIKTLGSILNRDSMATIKNEELKLQLDTLAVHEEKRSVYYVVGYGNGGDFTAPKNTMIHEIIEHAGGKNVGETLENWQISKEFLFENDPDFIFIREEDYPHFIKTEPYNELTAVRKGRTYPIESGWIDIVSPRNFLAINYIADKLRNTGKIYQPFIKPGFWIPFQLKKYDFKDPHLAEQLHQFFYNNEDNIRSSGDTSRKENFRLHLYDTLCETQIPRFEIISMDTIDTASTGTNIYRIREYGFNYDTVFTNFTVINDPFMWGDTTIPKHIGYAIVGNCTLFIDSDPDIFKRLFTPTTTTRTFHYRSQPIIMEGGCSECYIRLDENNKLNILDYYREE